MFPKFEGQKLLDFVFAMRRGDIKSYFNGCSTWYFAEVMHFCVRFCCHVTKIVTDYFRVCVTVISDVVSDT